MSDALDRLALEAGPLLRRVDATLAETGAPPGDPVWALLRRVRALPADAVAAVAGWRPEPLSAAAEPLRSLARRYVDAIDALPASPPWEGDAAEAFRFRLAALRGYVQGPGADSVVGRLRATVAYLEELAAWLTRTRRVVAVALADVLSSAEAVALVTASAAGRAVAVPAAGGIGAGGATAGWAAAGAAGVPQSLPAGTAAARIATRVLTPVATACDEARALHDDWRPRLGQVVHRPPSFRAATGQQQIRIGE